MMINDPIISAYHNLIGHRRDLDIRSIPMRVGLDFKRNVLNEVYHINDQDFNRNSDEDSEKIHENLRIPKINHSVDHYLGSGSTDINHFLWENHLHGSSIPNHIKHHIKSIDSVLKPKTEGQFRLYSGLPMSPAYISATEWNSTRPKKLIHIPSYTSATTNFDVASHFTNVDTETKHHESDHHGIILPNARHVIELNFPHGIHDAASMMHHSGAKHEEEVLLGRDHEFELHPRPTLIHDSAYHDPIYVWKANSFGAQKKKKVLY